MSNTISVEAVDSLNADGSVSKRYTVSGSIPISLWGLVLLNGEKPQIRSVRAGQQGHDSALSYYYLRELMDLRSMQEMLGKLKGSAGWPKTYEDRVRIFKKIQGDLIGPIHDEIFYIFHPLSILANALGDDGIDFVELGSTFFSSIEKLKIFGDLADLSVDRSKIHYSAIDNSRFFLQGSKLFHPEDNVTYYSDFRAWKPAARRSIMLSRIVAGYAVENTRELASWSSQFDAFHLIEVANGGEGEYVSQKNGMRQVFLDLPQFTADLRDRGVTLYLSDICPDYNSDLKVATIRLFGLRRECDERLGLADRLRSVKVEGGSLKLEALTPETARLAVQEALESLDDAQWERVKAYKQAYPMWGETPSEFLEAGSTEAFEPVRGLDLSIAGGAINNVVRRELQRAVLELQQGSAAGSDASAG